MGDHLPFFFGPCVPSAAAYAEKLQNFPDIAVSLGNAPDVASPVQPQSIPWQTSNA